MRIVLVYDALYPFVRGGAERRNHELAIRLSRDHDVHVVSWRFWDGPQVLEQDGITYHGVGAPPALYGGDGKRRVREVVNFSLRILPVLLRQRFDVIDCSATPYVPLYAAWLASRVTRTPLVVTWHEYWGEHWHDYLPQRPVLARIARAVESTARHLGDALVAVSAFTARRLERTDPDGRLRVVGNGVSLSEIQRATRAKNEVDLLFVGRLIDEKRIDLLLEAVALLRDRLPTLRCTIIGEGPDRPALERHAMRLEIGSRVRFVGALSNREVYAQMKAASLFVLPSIREGFGVAVIEAQAGGSVPVVVRSPMSAAQDLVRDGVDGRLCDPDAVSLAEAIADLLTDRRRLRRMSAEARRTARRHDWAAVAEQMERAYLSVTRPSAEPATVP